MRIARNLLVIPCNREKNYVHFIVMKLKRYLESDYKIWPFWSSKVTIQDTSDSSQPRIADLLNKSHDFLAANKFDLLRYVFVYQVKISKNYLNEYLLSSLQFKLAQ